MEEKPIDDPFFEIADMQNGLSLTVPAGFLSKITVFIIHVFKREITKKFIPVILTCILWMSLLYLEFYQLQQA